MEHRPLGLSGVEVSRVGLGGYELGPEPDEDPDVARAARVIATAIECGVNWLDTSEGYLETRNEAVIGAALRHVPDGFLVASKVAPGAGVTGGKRLSAQSGLASLRGELEAAPARVARRLLPALPGSDWRSA
jgi:aryl-alcohol dehydrogenase-like predicted oxidoreductase